jgi:hypothetical protein
MILTIKLQEKLCLSGDSITGVYGILGQFTSWQNLRNYYILQDPKTLQTFICELTDLEIERAGTAY